MNERTTGPGFADQSSNKSGASIAYEGAAKFAADAAEEIKQSKQSFILPPGVVIAKKEDRRF